MRRLMGMALALALCAGLALQARAAHSAPEAGDLLKYLPDGTGVIVLDVQRMTSSNLWASLSSQSSVRSALERVQGEAMQLGLRLTDLNALAVVFASGGMSDFTAAASGNFNSADLIEKLRGNDKLRLQAAKYKDVDIYDVSDAATPNRVRLSFVFPEAATVVAGHPAGVRAALDVHRGEGAGVAQNAKLMEIFNQAPDGAIRLALEMSPSVTGRLQSNEVPLPDFSSVRLIFGTLDVSENLDLNLTMRTDKADQAKVIADRLNGLLNIARGYFSASSNDPKIAAIGNALKSLAVTNTDIDVKVNGSLPGELLSQVLR